jgi:hypothetical protein
MSKVPTFPECIPTEQLKQSDVPNASAPWSIIGLFALTFDKKELDPYQLKDQDLSKLSIDSSLTELRAHLFFEQRRWNHFGRAPDPAVMSEIRRILLLISVKAVR